ncbi:reverse transcriptase [Plasmopara halstedii]|uniref:Reverse transcriptase n=1 Tax=Plasmopara halstedii TaxID=4781 RepID=A0A0P1AWT1_PLAHL|nr:reverse transcriptase [Plasmopara halstedii]CEG46272.1 reverse transcriptase [Plasmopara halstedii]|eukprot:XP_024582641.1 reverse transcriptase [Plasmopara halstedii]
MRSPSVYILLTTTALLVTRSTALTTQPLFTPSDEELKPTTKRNATKISVRAPSANVDEKLLESRSSGTGASKMAVTLHLVGGIENSAQQEAKQAMKKLPEMLHPRVPHDSQHFVRDSKMGIPSSSTALHDQTLSQKQIEVGLAFLKEYNKNMEHAEVIDQAEVLKCLEKDDISGLEALVVEHNKPLISAKRMNLATLLNLVYGDKNARDMINTFTKTFKSSSIKRKGMKVAATQPFKNSHQLLDKRSTPVTEETKSLTRYGYTWPDPVLTEAFAAYSPHINQFQLTEWKNQGKLAEDMVEKLSNYPHEEAIRDGSLLKAFVAYIDLWNIKLSPKELNLFESLKTQFGDYVAASGKHSERHALHGKNAPFQSERLPFGCSAPATFNRLVTQLFRLLRAHAQTYFDDIFVHSHAEHERTDEKNHTVYLRAVLVGMRTIKLYANADKGIFDAEEIPFSVCFIEKRGI